MVNSVIARRHEVPTKQSSPYFFGLFLDCRVASSYAKASEDKALLAMTTEYYHA